MNDTLVFENYQPQNIVIDGGGSVIGLTTVLVNGVDVTEGSVAYVVVPTKVSELQNDAGYLTAETDPTVPYYLKQITISDINRWNNKQDLLVSGTNIKTINNNSVLGSGNIEITETPYTAGTGIEINNHEISNTITSYNDLTDLPTIPTKTSDLTNDSDYVVSSSLSEVAFSGSYLDLDDQPVIPQATSQLENDSGFITKEVNNLDNYMLKQYLDLILPKASGSGTSITLDDTVGAELNPILKGNTSQASDPTPSSPQPIHSVTGDNSIKVENKNLWKSNYPIALKNQYATIDINNSGGINITLGSGQTIGWVIYDIGKLSDYYNKTLTLSIGNEANTMYRECGFLSSDNDYQNRVELARFLGSNKTTYTITENNKNKRLLLRFYISGGTGSTLYSINNIQLEYNSNATEYQEPSLDTYPLTLGTLEYSKIPNSNYEDEFIIPKNNLFDVATWVTKGNNSTYYSYSNGKLSINATDSRSLNDFVDSEKIYLENGTYYLSNIGNATIRIYDQNSSVPVSTNQFEVTLGYIYLKLVSSSVMTCEPMINKGTTALPYEPYNNGKWYLKKHITKTLNAENYISNTGIGGDGLRYAMIPKTDLGIISGSQITGIMLCNKFKEQTISSSRQVGEFLTNSNNTGVQFMVGLEYDTIEKIQQAYPNITCYGANSTPTYIPLNDTLQEQLTNIYNNMMSKKGQTNISQANDDLPMVISVSTFKTIGG